MRIVVDRDLCTGHAWCVVVAPAVFDIDDSCKVVLLIEEPPESMRHKMEEAVRLCPDDAIVFADD